MNKHYPIIGLILLLSIGIVNATWCYQESATVPDQMGTDGTCALSYTGSYYTANSGDNRFYFNYTKPVDATSSSKVQVKFGSPYCIGGYGCWGGQYVENYSFSSGNGLACWNANPNTLELSFVSSIFGGGTSGYTYCFDGANWLQLGGQIEYGITPGAISGAPLSKNPAVLYDGDWSTSGEYATHSNGDSGWITYSLALDNKFYEEGMFWNIPGQLQLLHCYDFNNDESSLNDFISMTNATELNTWAVSDGLIGGGRFTNGSNDYVWPDPPTYQSYINLSNDVDLGNVNKFSFEVWFKMNETGVNKALFSRSIDGRGTFDAWIYNDKIRVTLSSSQDVPNALYVSNPITTDSWHQILIVERDNSLGTDVFFDGVALNSSYNIGFPYLEFNQPFTLGGEVEEFTPRARATFDLAKIYKGQMYPATVQSLYNAGAGVACADTEAIVDADNAFSCTPDWYCARYASCDINDQQVCNRALDNNHCGALYTGDYSEFTPLTCDYCTPDWACSGYASCDSNNTELCNAVTDLNNCVNPAPHVYGGDYLEFTPRSCDFCTPSWRCIGYATCVRPQANTPCDDVYDNHVCAEPYTGNYSEFTRQACTYHSSGATVSTDVQTCQIMTTADGTQHIRAGCNSTSAQTYTDLSAPALSIVPAEKFDIISWVKGVLPKNNIVGDTTSFNDKSKIAIAVVIVGIIGSMYFINKRKRGRRK